MKKWVVLIISMMICSLGSYLGINTVRENVYIEKALAFNFSAGEMPINDYGTTIEIPSNKKVLIEINASTDEGEFVVNLVDEKGNDIINTSFDNLKYKQMHELSMGKYRFTVKGKGFKNADFNFKGRVY